MPSPTVAFLGPEGTFAHLAAKRRFGRAGKLVPIPSIKEVFDYVSGAENRIGVVPIENSSGGTILETMRDLTSGFHPLYVQESLTVNVRLALLGKDREKIRIIYSHFAPLLHCEDWLLTNFPNAELHTEQSTGLAVKKAATQNNAAAIGNKDAGKRYGLKILEFPIQKEKKNVTQFFVLGHHRNTYKGLARTTIVAALPNRPGSLVDFLEPFRNYGVNLCRILSQPVIGSPETYVFLVDLAGSEREKHVTKALKEAEAIAVYLKSLGSYPVRTAYNS